MYENSWIGWSREVHKSHESINHMSSGVYGMCGSTRWPAKFKPQKSNWVRVHGSCRLTCEPTDRVWVLKINSSIIINRVWVKYILTRFVLDTYELTKLSSFSFFFLPLEPQEYYISNTFLNINSNLYQTLFHGLVCRISCQTIACSSHYLPFPCIRNNLVTQ